MSKAKMVSVSRRLKASIPGVQTTYHQSHNIRDIDRFTADSVHLKKPSVGPKGLIGPPCHGGPPGKQKIFFYIDGLRSGGKEWQMIELLKNLYTKKEYDLIVVIMNRDIYYKEIYDLDVNIHILERKSRRDLSIFLKFYRLCREHRPEVIHAWDSLSAVYALPAAKLLRIKLINGFIRHAARPRFPGKFWFVSKLTTSLSHRNISNSMAGLEAHKLNPSLKNRCIVNGFDPERLKRLKSREETRQRFSISEPHVVGMVANFEDRKDYNTFLQAAERIVGSRKGVMFLAVGDGKNFQQCQAVIKKELRQRIKLVGRQGDIDSIVNIFDIGLLINNTNGHAEGISNSIMEYMALGKPVIATDSGGNKELVLHDKTGFIIEPFDVDELTRKIEHLLDHKEQAEQMGRSGKKRIQQDFNMERMVNQYIDLYGEF